MTVDTTPGIDVAPPRRKVTRRIAVTASLLLVLAAVAASMFIVISMDRQMQEAGRAYEVRRLARELMLALVDAETGERGYIISRDRAYLAPYNAATGRLNETWDTLVTLVRDDPEQLARLHSIEQQLEAKRAVMSDAVELVGAGRVSDAVAMVRTDTGIELMDDIRRVMRGFIADEDARLDSRNAELSVTRQWLFAAMVLALAGSAILAIGLFARTQRRVSALAEERTLLQNQNEQLEAHVRARTLEAEEARAHAERERARLETLLQDTNHRIGNSLATVSSLLGLQLARSGSDEVRSALEAAQNRVQAIASAHRRLRLGADLESTEASDFLADVVADIASTQTADVKVALETDVEPMVIPARDATTIGIVVSELVTNALKHAFPAGRAGTIRVVFRRIDGVPVLSVEDDGIGMTGEPSQTGLGALIIRQLARQFGGEEQSYTPRDGGGTVVTVQLPKLPVEAG
jgi:two-component sensor histidine kinase/CHASE3 domain sensor protein